MFRNSIEKISKLLSWKKDQENLIINNSEDFDEDFDVESQRQSLTSSTSVYSYGTNRTTTTLTRALENPEKIRLEEEIKPVSCSAIRGTSQKTYTSPMEDITLLALRQEVQSSYKARKHVDELLTTYVDLLTNKINSRYRLIPPLGITSTIMGSSYGVWRFVAGVLQPGKQMVHDILDRMSELNDRWHTTKFDAAGIDPMRDPYNPYARHYDYNYGYDDGFDDDFIHSNNDLSLQDSNPIIKTCSEAFLDWQYVGGGTQQPASPSDTCFWHNEAGAGYESFHSNCIEIYNEFCKVVNDQYKTKDDEETGEKLATVAIAVSALIAACCATIGFKVLQHKLRNAYADKHLIDEVLTPEEVEGIIDLYKRLGLGHEFAIDYEEKYKAKYQLDAPRKSLANVLSVLRDNQIRLTTNVIVLETIEVADSAPKAANKKHLTLIEREKTKANQRNAFLMASHPRNQFDNETSVPNPLHSFFKSDKARDITRKIFEYADIMPDYGNSKLKL